jgi:hypothetical protein
MTLNPATVVPARLKPDDWLGYKIIAVIGYNNDWSAYMGLSHWSDEEVANSGDKLDEETACGLFSAPVRAGLTYRY